MDKRTNSIHEIVAKRGIELSKRKGSGAARKLMQLGNLPINVIERLLKEPNNIRSTDLLD